MKNYKNEKGVTLVSLTVTVTIMMILAGITIHYTVGNNGFITKAQETKQNALIAEAEANEVIKNYKTNEDSGGGVIAKNDITAPTISQINLTGDTDKITVEVVVTDQESGIKSIKYSIDGGTTWESDYKDAKAKKYIFTGLEANDYVINVQVEDNNGNVANATSDSITLQ